MTVRMESSAVHLERLHSIPDVAEYIASLVLAVDQTDAACLSGGIVTGSAIVTASNRKQKIFAPVSPDKS